MKLSSYAQNMHDLNILKDAGLSEVILEHKEFARFGKLDDENFLALSARASELGLRVLFEWDILMTENTFKTLSQKLLSFENSYAALRVQDPGAFNWALENTQKPLQFIAESANHNKEALLGWIDFAKGRMERISLSIELSKDILSDYCKTLPVPCEILGFGRILLFYTPRFLLSPLGSDKIVENEELAAIGESEESPHKGFPIVENRHGTYMFHIKEFSLVEFSQDLLLSGMAYFRVDLRWESREFLKTISSLVNSFDASKFETFKDEYPQDLMRGFYLVNKTDVLFPKLKNSRLQKREGNYIGEVVEAEKGSHLAIMVKNAKGLKKTDVLKIIHPKGEEFEARIYSLKNLSLEDVEVIPGNQMALIQFVGGIWVKSQVFYA
jgi:putative protease